MIGLLTGALGGLVRHDVAMGRSKLADSIMTSRNRMRRVNLVMTPYICRCRVAAMEIVALPVTS